MSSIRASIRRTTLRVAATTAMTFASVGLLATASLAQYPPPPFDVIVTTPGAQIGIFGGDFAPGSQVEVVICFPASQNCGTVLGTSAPQRATTTAVVQPDGTFEAPYTVPENAPEGEIQYVVKGVDESGQERSDAGAINVVPAAVDGIAEAPGTTAGGDTSAEALPGIDTDGSLLTTDGDNAGLGLALAAAAGMGAVALAGGAVVASRRRRAGVVEDA